MPAAIPFVVAGFQAYAAVTATSAIVAGLYTVAAVSTALGAITKNKDLQRLGAIAGLAGGVGSVMTSAGNAAGAAAGEEAAKTVAEKAGATGLENTAAEFSTQASQTIADANAAIDNSTAALNLAKDAPVLADPANISIAQSGGMGSGAGNGLLADAMAPSAGLDAVTTQSAFNSAPVDNMFNTGQLGQQTGQSLLNSPAAEPLVQQTANIGPNVQQLPDASAPAGGSGLKIPGSTPSAASNTGAFKPSYDLTTASNASAGLPDAAAQNQSWFQKLNGFAKEYGKLTEASMGLIGGAAKSYSDQQTSKDNFNRQRDYQEWLRQRYNDSVRNLTIPGVVLNRNGSNGIINAARG